VPMSAVNARRLGCAHRSPVTAGQPGYGRDLAASGYASLAGDSPRRDLSRPGA
jgi:hypothetical protein